MSNVTKVNGQPIEKECVITLKEILDVINIDRSRKGENPLIHAKAILKVKKLAEEPSFGVLSKMAITSTVKGGRPYETYLLTKKQAIAVGVKLDNKRLMAVIDKLEELTTQTQQIKLPSKSELAQMVIESEAQIEKLQHKVEEKDKLIVVAADLNIQAGEVNFADFAKNLGIVGFGRNKVVMFCRKRQYLEKVGTAPYQKYVNAGYFTRKPSAEKINGKVRYTTMLTARGSLWLAKEVYKEIERNK